MGHDVKTIRRSVFETNSSSSHSLTINSEDYLESNLYIDSEINKVAIGTGEFGWGYETYNDQYGRLMYLITMLLCTEGINCDSIEELKESDGYQLINNTIKDYCNCDGIEITDSINFDGKYGLEFNGYIDHQSCEYNNLQEFLDDWNTTVKKFVFSNITLIIDNDNH